MILLLTRPIVNITLASALVGTLILSAFPHQEARFLLPAVPLILSSVHPPRHAKRVWIASWIIFNCLLGLLMGVYHQGGVVETQAYLRSRTDIKQALWWKTYSPPTWLLGSRTSDLNTVDLMGLRSSLLENGVCERAMNPASLDSTVLVAPYSATFLDQFVTAPDDKVQQLRLRQRWAVREHLNLDDMDFGDDGFLPTLQRVVGRRGLVVFDVECAT